MGQLMYKIYKRLSTRNQNRVKYIYNSIQQLIWDVRTVYMKLIGNNISLKKIPRSSRSKQRLLELGPGISRIKDFETLNVKWTPTTDYVYDATGKLPFADDTFDIVYASHIIEHVPWYNISDILTEWRRIIKPGGQLEIWTPDLQKIIEAALNAETKDDLEFHKDGWFKFNSNKDPILWLNGRIFSYGDGTGSRLSENWHLSGYNRRLLNSLLLEAGFNFVEELSIDEVRGYNHGWINLGVKAIV